jgi:hypothetical protein
MDSTKPLSLTDMINKFDQLKELVPYVEKFCSKYRELFPSDDPKVEQQNLFKPIEQLLNDDSSENDIMRNGTGSNIFGIIKNFNRPMLPIEIKKAYQKIYLPHASKEEIKKTKRNIQASLMYLIKVKKIVTKNSDGKYQLVKPVE